MEKNDLIQPQADPEDAFDDSDSPEGSKGQRGGRRHCLMTLEDEKAFVSSFCDESDQERRAYSVKKIHEVLERTLGRKITKSTTYRMLKRHGWTKQETAKKRRRVRN
jgi:transposase